MDKKQLLRKIAGKELDYICRLSEEKFFNTVSEWFGEGMLDSSDRKELTKAYIDDFMSYREEESEEELLEYLG